LINVLPVDCVPICTRRWRITTQQGLEVPMRIPKSLPILAVGGLLLAASQLAATGVSAQPFGYGKLTPAQKAHVSGLLSLELGGRGLRTAAPARSSLTTVTPPPCDVNLGSNIKVNQNCLNVTDSDLQGRGQAQRQRPAGPWSGAKRDLCCGGPAQVP